MYKKVRSARFKKKVKPGDTPKRPTIPAWEAAVLDNPHKDILFQAFKEGVSSPNIASYFAENGWIGTLSERSFLEYIRKFRATRTNKVDHNPDIVVNIDSLISANQPNVDPLVELNRLYRVQKLRINIDTELEISMGKLFDTTHKEINIAADILLDIAKIEGKVGGHQNNQAIAAASTENLRDISKAEAAGDKMHSLTKRLKTLVDKERQAIEAKNEQTVKSGK